MYISFLSVVFIAKTHLCIGTDFT